MLSTKRKSSPPTRKEFLFAFLATLDIESAPAVVGRYRELKFQSAIIIHVTSISHIGRIEISIDICKEIAEIINNIFWKHQQNNKLITDIVLLSVKISICCIKVAEVTKIILWNSDNFC